LFLPKATQLLLGAALPFRLVLPFGLPAEIEAEIEIEP
jgi:hypothetical protein